MEKKSAPFALIVKKGIFSEYNSQKSENPLYGITRKNAIEKIVRASKQIKTQNKSSAIFVPTAGITSCELYEIRERSGENHFQDFLAIGGAGYASQIALSLAMRKRNSRIFCLDDDSCATMQMGAFATIGGFHPNNFVHIVLNSGSHDSLGGQQTFGRRIDFSKIVAACGYEKIYRANTESELEDALKKILNEKALTFLEIFVKKEFPNDLNLIKIKPHEAKIAFMDEIAKM